MPIAPSKHHHNVLFNRFSKSAVDWNDDVLEQLWHKYFVNFIIQSKEGLCYFIKVDLKLLGLFTTAICKNNNVAILTIDTCSICPVNAFLSIIFSANMKSPLSKPLFCNIFSETQVFLMGLHAVNAALHDDTAVEFQHIKTFLDDVTIAFCCEMLILEFLL